MEKVKIYCAFHKPYPTVDNSLIVPILMGNIKKYASILNYPTDDVGDNIADLNYTFCELTALYWIWKNDKSSDFSAKSCEKEGRKDKKEAWLDRLS